MQHNESHEHFAAKILDKAMADNDIEDLVRDSGTHMYYQTSEAQRQAKIHELRNVIVGDVRKRIGLLYM